MTPVADGIRPVARLARLGIQVGDAHNIGQRLGLERQTIHIWRSPCGVAIAADVIGTVLVRDDEEKIGRWVAIMVTFAVTYRNHGGAVGNGCVSNT